jgi:hypothetical protein
VEVESRARANGDLTAIDPIVDAIEFLRLGADGETLLQLLTRVSRRLGIRIEVHREGAGLTGNLTGFLYTTTGHAHILVRASDPLTYQCRCILHEVGHLLCGHSGCVGIAPVDDKAPLSIAGDQLTVSPLELSTSLSGNVQSSLVEEQAELVARAAERRLLRPRYVRDETTWGGA